MVLSHRSGRKEKQRLLQDRDLEQWGSGGMEIDAPLQTFEEAEDAFLKQKVGIDRLFVLAYLLEFAAVRYRPNTRRMQLFKVLSWVHRGLVLLLLLMEGMVPACHCMFPCDHVRKAMGVLIGLPRIEDPVSCILMAKRDIITVERR